MYVYIIYMLACSILPVKSYQIFVFFNRKYVDLGGEKGVFSHFPFM